VPSSSDPRNPETAAGEHLLGPQVIGLRVVVRRVVRDERGPSGGPALTDVLGVCTAWGDGFARVRTEEGTQVEIAIADIVSGKPVPPRPSMRHRVSPVDAQVHALALWPDLDLARLGAWTLRSSPTSTARRANSVLAMAPVGVPDPVARVVEHYHGLGRRPIAAVLPDTEEERLFLAAGWVPESTDSPTFFQIASVAHVRRGLRDLVGVEIALAESGGSGEPGDAVARAAARFGHPEPTASGTAAYSRDWVGLRSVDVGPEHRRRGLGRAVVGALLEWGAEHGASTAYLQVLGDNAPALTLYAGLGFRTHHAYRYLATPAGQSFASS